MSDATAEVEPEEPPIAVLYDHARRVYRAMLAEAKRREADELGEPDVIYWEGHLTRLIKDKLNYSAPYYTFITQALKRMGCIKQMRRGGGSAPSVWRLIKEPTEDLFHTAEELRAPGKTNADMVAQQMRDLGTRLTLVEQEVKALLKAFAAEAPEGG